MIPTRSRSTIAASVAGIAIAAVTIAGCSSAPGAASPAAAPSTVMATATVHEVTTAVRTVPVTRRVTSVHTVTDTVTSTRTPEPAGTRTVVKTKKVTARVTERHTVTAPPPEPAVSFGDGTYVVGKDVAPGTYQASDPNPPDGLCYWETRTADGELTDNGVNDGLLFIDGDVFSVRVADCGTWSPVG